MRVARCQAHHVLGVRDIDFDLEGHHLYVVGGDNDQGKTSALTALLMLLCGRSGMDWPEIALREGEDEGWVRATLKPDPEDQSQRGLEAELYLRRKRGGQIVESFKLCDEKGEPAPHPRTLLQQLYSLRGFDPLAFEKLPKKEKRELLMDLAGLDFSADEAEYKRIFDERTDVNRDGKRLKTKFDDMPLHSDAPKREISVEKLMQERKDREAHNDKNQMEREKLARFEDEVQAFQSKKDQCRRAVEEAQRALEAAESQLEQAQAVCEAQERTVGVLEDQDLTEIDEKILNAGEQNRRLRENNARKEVEEELAELRSKSQSLTDRLHDIRDRQANALREANWPVSGLSVDDEGVLFESIPFEQHAKSKRVLLSTQIAMALNPRLRLLVCQHGNDLGRQALEALEELLKEKDYQMILEVVTQSDEDESRCSVVIEDGKQKV